MRNAGWLLLVVMMSLVGCKAQPKSGDDPAAKVGSTQPAVDVELSQGYSLLHHLMAQEVNVDKILILKSAPDPVKMLIRAIAAETTQARDQIKELVGRDPQLQLQDAVLPTMELAARQHIESATTKSLLGSSGNAFATRLLLTQQSAMEYASALAYSLAARDRNVERREYLQTLGARFERLNQQVLAQLNK